MITEEQLIGRGYKVYFDKGGIIWPHASFFYQKRIDGERGIKYFINMVCYQAIAAMPTAWMCEVTHNDPHSTLQQHRVEDLDLAEARCEKFWDLMGKPYYEPND